MGMIITNLLSNMIVLTSYGAIATNTPAFEHSVLSAMCNRATQTVAAWKLPIPIPIETNSVTSYRVSWTPYGIYRCSFQLGDRYEFMWSYALQLCFSDSAYDLNLVLKDNVKSNLDIYHEWMLASNHLNLAKARDIARSSMSSVGLPLHELRFNQPKESKQIRVRWVDGKSYPLPYYEFRWETDLARSSIDVSGITGTVVYFAYIAGGNGPLRLPEPTNYLEMLGVGTNTIFVKRISAPDKPAHYKVVK